MEAQKSIFKPISHLINPEKLQQYECIICTQKSINLLQCKTCKNCLCNQCAIDQKQMNNTCPFRCSKGQLQLQIIQDLDLEFSCPFSTECPQILKTVKQFYEHDRVCKFINPNQKEQQRKKWEFKCMANHPLEVYIDTFQTMIKRKVCHSCNQASISRVICRKCESFYCRYCRPLPIFNEKCPIGHKMLKKQIKSSGYICDICQLSAAIINLSIYDDYCCNIGICEICFKSWPKFLEPIHCSDNLTNYCNLATFPEIKNSMKEEQYEKFKEQHRLKLLEDRPLKKCDSCEKQKTCYKNCLKCDKFYCYDCKIFDVTSNNQIIICQQDHLFEIIQIPEDKTINCDKCLKSISDLDNVAFQDSSCKITLCANCLSYSIEYQKIVTKRKFYPEDTICLAAGHTCFHLVSTYVMICQGCNKQKIIKLACNHCSPQKNYCCECIPTKNPQKCYCRRQLKKTDDLNNNYCLTCQNCVPQNIYGCLRCAYTICGDCIKARKHKAQLKQIEGIKDISTVQEIKLLKLDQ